MGKRGPQPIPLSHLIFWESIWYWVFLRLRGRDRTTKEALVRGDVLTSYRHALAEARAKVAKKEKERSDDLLPWIFHADQLEGEIESEQRRLRHERKLAEPEVWQLLVEGVQAGDPIRVRSACRQSKRWLNPEWRGREFVKLLSEEAEQFVCAKNDPFFPHGPYPSSDRKRVTFFARAMAGISCGISPSTSVGRLRKMKHGAECPCVNCKSDSSESLYRGLYAYLVKERKLRDVSLELKVVRAYLCPDRCGFESRSKKEMMKHICKRHGWTPSNLVKSEYMERSRGHISAPKEG
jgi:uncharacterized C2H2 Zn-finger protein